MLAGFLLFRLPVATIVNGSVSLAGRNGLSKALGEEKKKKRQKELICKIRPDVQRFLKTPVVLQGTSPSSFFSKGRNRLQQFLSKSAGSRDASCGPDITGKSLKS